MKSKSKNIEGLLPKLAIGIASAVIGASQAGCDLRGNV